MTQEETRMQHENRRPIMSGRGWRIGNESWFRSFREISLKRIAFDFKKLLIVRTRGSIPCFQPPPARFSAPSKLTSKNRCVISIPISAATPRHLSSFRRRSLSMRFLFIYSLPPHTNFRCITRDLHRSCFCSFFSFVFFSRLFSFASKYCPPSHPWAMSASFSAVLPVHSIAPSARALACVNRDIRTRFTIPTVATAPNKSSTITTPRLWVQGGEKRSETKGREGVQ